MMELLQCIELGKKFGDKIVLEDINLTIPRGKIIGLLGKNGTGKSTLIKLMLKELEPTSGKLCIAGQQLSKLKRRQVSKYRRNIGVVFQNFELLGDRNVYENVALAQRVIGVPKRKMKKNISSMLSLVGIADKAMAFPDELSGGERQRVALARALVNRPSILLADEPTGNLDPKNAWSIMGLLDEVNKLGTTVIVVTHNPEVVDTMQKRVIAIKDGVVVLDELKGGYIYERR